MSVEKGNEKLTHLKCTAAIHTSRLSHRQSSDDLRQPSECNKVTQVLEGSTLWTTPAVKTSNHAGGESKPNTFRTTHDFWYISGCINLVITSGTRRSGTLNDDMLSPSVTRLCNN